MASAINSPAVFAAENEYTVIPASTEHVVCYIACLGVRGATYGAAQTAVAAIADRHTRQILDSPCSHPAVKRVLGLSLIHI